MLKLKKVAITGSTSCGKSQVCKMFGAHGAYIVDSDEIVHQLLTSDTKLGRKVIELLGNEIVLDGKIDRARVAKKVFINPTALASLERILHPAVYQEINNRYLKVCKQNNPPPLFVFEIPLLFETEAAKDFDITIVVTADAELCWERYKKKFKNDNRQDFNSRRARMLDEQEKIKRADYVINNNGTLENLHLQVNQLFDALCH